MSGKVLNAKDYDWLAGKLFELLSDTEIAIDNSIITEEDAGPYLNVDYMWYEIGKCVESYQDRFTYLLYDMDYTTFLDKLDNGEVINLREGLNENDISIAYFTMYRCEVEGPAFVTPEDWNELILDKHANVYEYLYQHMVNEDTRLLVESLGDYVMDLTEEGLRRFFGEDQDEMIREELID